MSSDADSPMVRRDGGVSLLRPWVTTLTIQAQGSLVSALRGPDGPHESAGAKPLVRALRAVVVNNAKAPGPDDVFMGDGTGLCTDQDVEQFFDTVDQRPHHWYMHFIHAAETVGYMHPNEEIRRFWRGFYEAAVHRLHLSPEPREAMLARLGKDGMLEDAGALGSCPVCGHGRLVHVALTDRLRSRLAHVPRGHARAGLCANCLAPRTSTIG